ncbi:unnamed protein product [Phytomonas sp. EM1]|nr:unnamed protein product [Phytomonas sp. EM1]|eukprot:CCW59877.1 unnamed protein product [Phytomonas sp. isolate EM1]
MYGESGPPKGYSIPRHEGKSEKRCQYCGSTAHWSYACDGKEKNGRKASGPSPKLSPTQMLKYGIKRKRTEFVPEPTEREAFNAELKSLEKIIGDELRQEKRTAKEKDAGRHEKTKPEPAEVKKENPEETL